MENLKGHDFEGEARNKPLSSTREEFRYLAKTMDLASYDLGITDTYSSA